MLSTFCLFVFFFFNDTATTEIYTLSLHDALPISVLLLEQRHVASPGARVGHRRQGGPVAARTWERSEEHTSELQSRLHLVCRLLLEKKKKQKQKEQRALSEAAHQDVSRLSAL